MGCPPFCGQSRHFPYSMQEARGEAPSVVTLRNVIPAALFMEDLLGARLGQEAVTNCSGPIHDIFPLAFLSLPTYSPCQPSASQVLCSGSSLCLEHSPFF